MKIMICLHELVLGGATINAIELAASLRDMHGHEVVMFATPGPLIELVKLYKLRLIPAPPAGTLPSPSRMHALRRAVKAEKPDVIHAWEIWACMDSFYGVHLPMGVPLVVTDMYMTVTRLLPKSLTTTFGTQELVDKAKAVKRQRVHLLHPPIDVANNAPSTVDPVIFRRRWHITSESILLVTVSRLVDCLKGESLTQILRAIERIDPHLPIHLLIVGDGSARKRISEIATDINQKLGQTKVTLTGAMLDPRPAYAAADIVLGMGGSALRAMAFGKPVIVMGNNGFFKLFSPETAEYFRYHGFFGTGHGGGEVELATTITDLAARQEERNSLGRYSRQYVEQHHSLELISTRLSQLLLQTTNSSAHRVTTVIDALRTTALYLREKRYRLRAQSVAPMELH